MVRLKLDPAVIRDCLRVFCFLLSDVAPVIDQRQREIESQIISASEELQEFEDSTTEGSEPASPERVDARGLA